MLKNNAKNTVSEYLIEDGFLMVKLENKTTESRAYLKDIDKSFLQLHFCLNANANLIFNNGAYKLDLKENQSYLLYNPDVDLPIHLSLEPKAKVIALLITIEKFHTFFTKEAGLIHFLDGENKGKKYYSDKVLGPNEIVVLNQLYHYGLHSSLEQLYSKGKVYELISLYFNKSDSHDMQSCPFLQDEANVEKIRQAKEILIDQMVDPPTLNELAHTINLPLQHLKDGFKHIYGETVFTFLFNYKMEYARRLLATKKYNIAETSFEVGYSTPSHFIAAFKKKFGATPKKYMSSL